MPTKIPRILIIFFMLSCFLAACARHRAPGIQPVRCENAAAAPAPVPPPAPTCGNDALTGYAGLLVIAPHPDDETLGFAGLETAYLEQGKPVRVMVVTDGDAYCEACRFWKNSSVHGPLCNAADLSNFGTPAVDSFGEVRRGESNAAAAALGLPSPAFLGYPDTGLATAWANYSQGKPDQPLHRSDFSSCGECATCDKGYGGGPEIALTASTLIESLRQNLGATLPDTLIATTHWLDGHGDHSGLGNFVRMLNAQLPQPRAVAYTVIHAHSPKDTPHSDCWYPSPRSLDCACAEKESCALADPAWIASLRNYRFHPGWPAVPPDDADYGSFTHYCLPARLYEGETATKLEAVRAYKSQLGFAARNGNLPPSLAGIIDCNGYLISFVRSSEAFVLVKP